MEKKNILLAVVLAVAIYFLSFAGLVYSQGLEATKKALNASITYLEQKRSNAQVRECMAYLHMIDGMKKMWELDTKKPADSIPIWNDLIPAYSSKQPVCPLGGTYTIGRLNELPTCSIKEHNPDPSEFK